MATRSLISYIFPKEETTTTTELPPPTQESVNVIDVGTADTERTGYVVIKDGGGGGGGRVVESSGVTPAQALAISQPGDFSGKVEEKTGGVINQAIYYVKGQETGKIYKKGDQYYAETTKPSSFVFKGRTTAEEVKFGEEGATIRSGTSILEEEAIRKEEERRQQSLNPEERERIIVRTREGLAITEIINTPRISIPSYSVVAAIERPGGLGGIRFDIEKIRSTVSTQISRGQGGIYNRALLFGSVYVGTLYDIGLGTAQLFIHPTRIKDVPSSFISEGKEIARSVRTGQPEIALGKVGAYYTFGKVVDTGTSYAYRRVKLYADVKVAASKLPEAQKLEFYTKYEEAKSYLGVQPEGIKSIDFSRLELTKGSPEVNKALKEFFSEKKDLIVGGSISQQPQLERGIGSTKRPGDIDVYVKKTFRNEGIAGMDYAKELAKKLRNTNKEQVFYHTTTKENFTNILKEGLKPQGDNPIFLTANRDLAKFYAKEWNKNGKILKVKLDYNQLKDLKIEDLGTARSYNKPISPENIYKMGEKIPKSSPLSAIAREGKVFINGEKFVEFHPYKTFLRSNIEQVTPFYYPPSFAITKTLEGIRILRLDIQAPRKVIGYYLEPVTTGKTRLKDLPAYETIKKSLDISYKKQLPKYEISLKEEKLDKKIFKEQRIKLKGEKGGEFLKFEETKYTSYKVTKIPTIYAPYSPKKNRGGYVPTSYPKSSLYPVSPPTKITIAPPTKREGGYTFVPPTKTTVVSPPIIITPQTKPQRPTKKTILGGKNKPLTLPRQQKFSVFLRRFGVFKPIGITATQKEAFNIGRMAAGKSLGATFKVEGRGVKQPRKIPGFKTKITKKGVFYIEEPKYRLSVPTEVKEIQTAKLLKGGIRK